MTDRAREILRKHNLGAAAGGPVLAAVAEALSTPAMIDAPVRADLRDRAEFLCDRLDEFAHVVDSETAHREFYGHVAPALARLRWSLDTSRAVDEREVVALEPGFEAEYDDSDNSFTIRWPDASWLVTWANGKIVASAGVTLDSRAVDEPTDAMFEAGMKAWRANKGVNCPQVSVRAIYRAMRAAQGERT